jgi:hypothetical protein
MCLIVTDTVDMESGVKVGGSNGRERDKSGVSHTTHQNSAIWQWSRMKFREYNAWTRP